MGEPLFTPPARSSDLYRMPSGDWVKIRDIDGARVSMKPNRQTGEVGAQIHVNVAGSWHTVQFESSDDATRWLELLIAYRNDLIAPSGRAMNRAEAHGLISQLAGPAPIDPDDGEDHDG